MFIKKTVQNVLLLIFKASAGILRKKQLKDIFMSKKKLEIKYN